MKHKPDNQSYNRGLSLIVTVIFMSISVLFIIGLTQWAVLHAKLVRQSQDRELALQVAEAGIEYYRWHLAHAPEDFKTGRLVPLLLTLTSITTKTATISASLFSTLPRPRRVLL